MHTPEIPGQDVAGKRPMTKDEEAAFDLARRDAKAPASEAEIIGHDTGPTAYDDQIRAAQGEPPVEHREAA
ncbi:MAG: hypothetical protein WBK28_03920 [Minisyncoccia bacterium]